MDNYRDKIKSTIEIISRYKDKNVLIAFSGSKDSIVLYDLAKKVSSNFNIVYNNTTIDPPGTISFIRKYYPEIKIQHPDKSFFKLVEINGLPTSFRRWCCKKLKESSNKDYDIIILGIRASESPKRKERKIEEVFNNKINVNPLINWLDEDIFRYIKENNLTLLKYYNEPYNFKRHGCVMCPMATSKQTIKQAIMFPKYLNAIVKACKIYIDNHQHLDFVKSLYDEYDMVYLWLHHDLHRNGVSELHSNDLFGKISAKKIILEMIKGKNNV